MRSFPNLKFHVIITRKASCTIRECVLEAGNRYETGGILIGYHFGWVYLIAAVTVSDASDKNSRVSFVLDGAEHTQKANDIISGFRHLPTVLGIWHSHICDGPRFSAQDVESNKLLAELLGGALSMLVTSHMHAAIFSTYHISATGAVAGCRTTVCSKNGGNCI